jgi:hypothetical protein
VPIISASISWLYFPRLAPAFLPCRSLRGAGGAGRGALARIEQLIDQVLFNPAVPGQPDTTSTVRKIPADRGWWRAWSPSQASDHAIIIDRPRGCDTQGMAVQTSFAEKWPGPRLRPPLLALLGNDGEFDLALLDVKNRVRNFSWEKTIWSFRYEETVFPSPTSASFWDQKAGAGFADPDYEIAIDVDADSGPCWAITGSKGWLAA